MHMANGGFSLSTKIFIFIQARAQLTMQIGHRDNLTNLGDFRLL